METLRPRVPEPYQDIYHANRRLFGVEDLRDITLEQYKEKKGNDKDYWDLNDIQTWMEREVIHFDDMEFPYAAPEENSGYEGEEQSLSFAEMARDADAGTVEEALDYAFLKDQIAKTLNTLSEREMGILNLRFGLMDGETRTLEEIGSVYGITRDRVRQIESQVMSKMRQASRSQPLRDYLDYEGDGRLEDAHFYAGDGMRTERAVARLAVKDEVADEQESRPSRRVQRELLASLNFLEHIPNERPAPNTRAYREVNEAFQSVLEKSKWQFWADEEMYKSMGGKYLTSYPDVCNIIDEYFGNRLTVEHIATAWNTLLFNLRYPYGTEPADRIGQLTSRLLSTRMEATDEVELRIPPSYDYECGFLGAWLNQGHLIINGNAGDYVGMHMSGEARITVRGNAGYDAGFSASGNAHLEITGSAERRAGVNIRDNAVVSMASTRVNGGHGKGMRDNAQIIVGGKPIDAPVTSPVIRMTSKAAENYQTAPPIRLNKAPNESPAEAVDASDVTQSAPEVAATPLDILDAIGLELAKLDEQQTIPPLPPIQEENVPIYDDFRTVPILPKKKRQRTSTSPKAEPETAPETPPAETASEQTAAVLESASNAPQPQAEDEATEAVESHMDFDAASAYLGMDRDAFRRFAAKVGYEDTDLLRIDDIDTLKALFPVLRLPTVPESGYITVAEAAQRVGFRGTAAQFAKDLRELKVEIHRFRTFDGKAAQYIEENKV